ncbi:hypothetical protein GCM10010329_53170 [Streptomyces spiroverticillatus]|uniref:Secreted protein n=1 Tax=Streptomyces finlayi TaxID=67296 RepID=A0A918X1Z8_9ACTN|nr:hypothetical protein [Streptomyces finlayi]GHA23129.1 hypothetical protein GCM10010329_53170 [Streptomyces spiroverticillatus]GHD04727.1 hypothetical protein GCM10010334_54100 [Streptomyces finlayi]
MTSLSSRSARTRRPALAVAVAALALFATACSQPSQSSQPDNATGEGAAADAALKFRSCMKEHGIDMPESKPGDTVKIGEGQDPEKLQAAMTACNKGDSQAFKQGRSAGLDAMVKYARCMRGEGFDIPDPKQEGEALGTPEMVNQPGFDKAHEKCNKILTDAMNLDAEGNPQ